MTGPVFQTTADTYRSGTLSVGPRGLKTFAETFLRETDS